MENWKTEILQIERLKKRDKTKSNRKLKKKGRD